MLCEEIFSTRFLPRSVKNYGKENPIMYFHKGSPTYDSRFLNGFH
jgi:hypothetical protein